MQGIEEDQGYQSTEEDEFHLTTSDEFCGGNRSRARRSELRSDAPGLPISEELDLEELKLWDEEELHCTRAPRVPAAEVLQLLREVPPSLRSRYCARLRLEAQRRRVAQAERAEGAGGAAGAADGGGWRWKRWTCIGCCILVTCATWAHPNPAATAMTSIASVAPGASADVPRDRFQQLTAHRPAGSPVNGTALGCPEALKRAEDEAIAMEVLTKRDIMGYNQMLASIHDWSSTLTTRVPASIANCLQVEGPRFLNLVEDLRASLLSAHARAARARARLTMERNARIFLSE